VACPPPAEPGYHHGVDDQQPDRLILLLWVLGLAFLGFVLLAGVKGMTP
jgi:hypothetical protein